jgi:hypothetical protein
MSVELALVLAMSPSGLLERVVVSPMWALQALAISLSGLLEVMLAYPL